MWNILSQVMGALPPSLSLPERMFMMALAGTGIIIMITSAIRMIEVIGRGGRQ